MRICNHYNSNKIKQICKLDFAKHIFKIKEATLIITM